MRGLLIAGVALMLLSPPADALEVTGVLAATSAQFPANAEVDGHPLALLLNATPGEASAVFVADQVHIVIISEQSVLLATNHFEPFPQSRHDYNFTHAAVVIHNIGTTSDLGGYPGIQSALNFTSPSISDAKPARHSTISDGYSVRPSQYELPWYQVELDQPHVVISAPGTATIAGAWAVKVRGTHVVVNAREGHFEFDTTERQDSAVQLNRSWLVMESSNLTGTISSETSPITTAFASGSVTWMGPALITGASGELHSGADDYRAQRERVVTLDGDLLAAFSPSSIDDQPIATLSISGDLRSTSLVAAGNAAAPGPGVPSWIIGAVAVFAVGLAATGGGVALLVRRSKVTASPIPPSVQPASRIIVPPDDKLKKLIEIEGIEFVTNLMEEVADEDQWDEALRIARAVQEVAPTSVRVAVAIANYLELGGRVQESLRAWETASKLAPDDGAIDYDAAVAALANDHPLEDVETWILRALKKSPDLWKEVDALPPHISERPAISKAIREARER